MTNLTPQMDRSSSPSPFPPPPSFKLATPTHSAPPSFVKASTLVDLKIIPYLSTSEGYTDLLDFTPPSFSPNGLTHSPRLPQLTSTRKHFIRSQSTRSLSLLVSPSKELSSQSETVQRQYPPTESLGSISTTVHIPRKISIPSKSRRSKRVLLGYPAAHSVWRSARIMINSVK